MSDVVSKRLAELRNEWPKTCAQLECSYWLGCDAGVSRDHKYNDAGYVLWGLRRMAAAVGATHGAHDYTRVEIDDAAAFETRYHWERGSKFRRPAAALTACWAALVVERPERLAAARKRVGPSAKRQGGAVTMAALFSERGR